MKKNKLNKPLSKKTEKTAIQSAETFNKKFVLLSVLITVIALFPVLFNSFINFDDPQYILDNSFIHKLSAENIKAVFTNNFVGNYQPVTMFFYMLIHSIFKVNPFGYHLFSLLFHSVNTALVFIVFFQLSGRNITALITALLFGVHPMHVESVAWASSLKDVLYTFFFLLAFYYYIIYSRENSKLHFVFSLLFFSLSILCKAQAVVLPITLFLVDFLTKRKFDKKLLIEKIPFFVLSLIFGGIAILIQKKAGAVQDYAYFPVWERILFSCYGLLNYFYKLLLPINLSIFYPYPETNDHINSVWVYIAPVVLIAMSFLFIKWIKKSDVVVFGILFFILTIALVLQLIPVGDAIVADRYTYLSATGIFFIIAWHFENYCLINVEKKQSLFTVAFIVVIILSGLSMYRSTLWKNSISIYTDALKKGKVPIILNNRGAAYHEIKNDSLAIADFEELVKIKPRYPNGYKNLASSYQLLNRNNEALDAFTNALKYFPNDDAIYFGRAGVLKSFGKTNEALADADKAISIHAENTDAIFLRAELYGQSGTLDKALIDLNTVLSQRPNYAQAYSNIAIVYSMKGDFEKAIQYYSEALKINPDLYTIYMNRSLVYKSMGKYHEALNDAIYAKNKGYTVSQNYLDELKKLSGN
jgi:tetratricopeptide (TPR) repeat protein